MGAPKDAPGMEDPRCRRGRARPHLGDLAARFKRINPDAAGSVDEMFTVIRLGVRRTEPAWDPRRLHTLEVRMEHDYNWWAA